MSEKKTIQINPDLFKFPEKATRKKQPKITAPKIEMKSNLKKQKQKSLRRNVLKMIREKQQDEYKRLFDSSEKKIDKPNYTEPTSSSKEFDKDFADSLDFFLL
jgi:nitrate reductase assembly molybdenum cofactor insertion protein NarJ